MSEPRRRGGTSRSGWLVVAVGVAVLVYIGVNTLRTSGPGSRGLAPGRLMPPFAAPLAASDLIGDANVATRAGEGQAGRRPACSIADPRALNSCALTRRGPVVLAFMTESSGRCVAALDAIGTVAPRFPRVSFAAVAVRGDRGDLRTLVRRHRWSFPVAQDRDGAVANLYGVAICPTVVFAYRGGRVMRTALGSAATTPAALERSVRALLRGGPA